MLSDGLWHATRVVVLHVRLHDKVQLNDVRERTHRAHVPHHAFHTAQHPLGMIGDVGRVIHGGLDEEQIDQPFRQHIALQAERMRHRAHRADARVDELELRVRELLREVIASVLPPSATRCDGTAEKDDAPAFLLRELALAVRQSIAQLEVVVTLRQLRGIVFGLRQGG